MLWGISIRGERRVSVKHTLFGQILSTIPFNSRFDEILGGPRLLPAGDTTLRSIQGREFTLRQQLEVGVIKGIGRSRRSMDKSHPYFGLGIGAHRLLHLWDMDITTLASGMQYRSKGAQSVWYLALSPLVGYRTRGDGSGFEFEARVVLLERFLHDGAPPETQFLVTVGYIWGL